MEKRYISIKEVLNVVWGGRVLMIVCAAIVAVLALGGSLVYESSVKTVSTVLALEWNGLTDGEYPDGSRFDYSNMFESYVISNSIGNVEVTTEDLRENLSVTPIQPNDVLAIVENALTNGEKISYYASEYQISLDVGEAGISVEEGTKIISNIIDNYRLDFEKKYIQSASVLDFTDADYQNLDYIEIQSIFKAQLDVIENEMTTLISEVGNFTSISSENSFNDILVRANLIRKTEYSTLSSKISSNLLTKDEDQLLNKLLFQKEEAQSELAIAEASSDMINSLITNYTGGTSTIIIPGNNDDEDIVIDVYYKELVDHQILATNEVARLEQEVAAIDTMINRYKGLDPDFVVSPAQQTIEEAKVLDMIPNLDKELSDLVSDTNNVLEEYNAYLISGQITPLMAPQQERSLPLVLMTLVGGVVGAVVGVAVTLYKHEWE